MSAPTAHFIGIGGIHMSGLARILLDEGWSVSGSDLVASHLTQELTARGATVKIGHAASNVCGADLVIRTAAVKDENTEVAAARAAGRVGYIQCPRTAGAAPGHRRAVRRLTLLR